MTGLHDLTRWVWIFFLITERIWQYLEEVSRVLLYDTSSYSEWGGEGKKEVSIVVFPWFEVEEVEG